MQRLISRSFIVMALAVLSFLTACADQSTESGVDGTAPTVSNSETTDSAPSTEAVLAATVSDSTESADKEILGTMVPTVDPSTLPTIPSELDADGDGFYSRDEMVSAVRRAYPAFHWPTGYSVTVEDLIVGYLKIWGPTDTFEGLGEFTVIGIANDCAWLLNWKDAYESGDTAGQEESIAQLRNTMDLIPLRTDPGLIEAYTEAFDLAELGDGSKLLQMTTLCDPSIFTPASPVSSAVAVSERQQ